MQRVKACSGPVSSVACPGPDQKRKEARPAQGQIQKPEQGLHRAREQQREVDVHQGPAQGQSSARQGRARSAPLPMSSWRLWPTKSKPNGTCLGGTAALFQEAPQGVATRWRQIAHHCYDWKQRRKYKRDMCSQVAQVAAANFTTIINHHYPILNVPNQQPDNYYHGIYGVINQQTSLGPQQRG